jgi:hypothetical protein
MQTPGTHLLGCWRGAGDSREFLGVAFINNMIDIGGFRKAEAGFSFSPEVGAFTQVRLVKGCVTYALSFLCESLFGTTPENNRGAVSIVKRSGMKVFGPVPDFCKWHDGVVAGAYISQASKSWWFRLPQA